MKIGESSAEFSCHYEQGIISNVETSSLISDGSVVRRHRAVHSIPKQISPADWLDLKDELEEARRATAVWEAKVRELTAHLARVEEAAKRALVQYDPTFRQGGAAQKLLDAECALSRIRAERAEIVHRFQRYKQTAARAAQENASLKGRLAAALSAQRSLALEVGKLQTSSKKLAKSNRAVPTRVAEESAVNGQTISLVKHLAEQQDLVASCREEIKALKTAAKQGPAMAWQQYRPLIGALENCLQLMVMSQIDPRLTLQSDQQGLVWVLLDWEHNGVHYLLDPLSNTVYSHDDWPQPVGYLTCGGADKTASLHFQGPRTTLTALTRRLSSLVRRDDDHQHVGLQQAPARIRQDQGPLTGDEELIHVLLAPAPEGLGLSAITVLGVTAKLSCTTLQQLPAPLERAVETVSAAGSSHGSGLLGDSAGQQSQINGSYKQLCSWLQQLVPSLDKIEICYLLLYLRCWDLRQSGGLGLAASRCALRRGIIWRVGSGSHFGSHASKHESCGSFRGACPQEIKESHELRCVGDESSTIGYGGESCSATNSGPNSFPVPLGIHSPILSP